MAQHIVIPNITQPSLDSSEAQREIHAPIANIKDRSITIVGVEGFEPPKSTTPDLQSGADRHLCSTPEHQLPKKFDVSLLVAHRPPYKKCSTAQRLKITEFLR